MRQADNSFPMPKKNLMRQEMTKILKQVIKDHNENVEPASEDDSVNSDLLSLQTNLTLKEELEMQILQEKEDYFKKINFRREADYEKTLKKEMSSYEIEGVRGKNLSLMYDFLITVKPTSVEAERAFSAAGYICNSLRSRLGDNTINTICFLRSFFQTQK